jgi:integrase/recombinase XerD
MAAASDLGVSAAEAASAPSAANLALIDEFCDNLWLEQGLAKNSLEAYRRDLRLFARWLQIRRPACASLHQVQAHDLAAYFAERHAESKPSSANRRLSVLKRFYQLALRQKQVAADPCLKIASAKQPSRFVHTLTEQQVEALLGAPDVATPLGLRERTMLELMYASGLRYPSW